VSRLVKFIGELLSEWFALLRVSFQLKHVELVFVVKSLDLVSHTNHFMPRKNIVE